MRDAVKDKLDRLTDEGNPIANPVLEEIREATSQDQELSCVSELVKTGLPTKLQEMSLIARPYHSCHHEISGQSGLLFKGDRLIVLSYKSLRNSMVKKIHSAHLGMGGCLRRARVLGDTLLAMHERRGQELYNGLLRVCCPQTETMPRTVATA